MSLLQKCLVIAAAAWHLAACGKVIGIEDLPEVAPDATPAPVYTVRGTAVGLLEPVSLRLEHPDGFELLTVEADGTFAFEAQLGDGAIYSVTLLGDPPCVIGDAFGTVSGNVPLVQLACESVLLSALAIDGAAAPEIAFEPAERSYEAEVSILQQSVRIVAATAVPGSTINVAGVPVASGVPSEPIALALGQNDIDIAVANANGVQRIYRVSVMRAAEIAQYAYGKASNTGAGDGFGASVAIWGDTLVAGAPFEDSSAAGVDGAQDTDDVSNSGAVYVFKRHGATWLQEAYLKASDSDLHANFGKSVALWGDTLAVGSPYWQGSVYVFRRRDASWAEEAKLAASNGGDDDQFGRCIALWDDTLVISAPNEDSAAIGINGAENDDSASNSGAAYVFRRSGDQWRQEAYLKASNTQSSDEFGHSIALWEDTLVVGAPYEGSSSAGINGPQNDDGATNSGAIYVFQRNDAYWMQAAYIKSSQPAVHHYFGSNVSAWQDWLAVSSPASNGSVSIFHRVEGFWAETAILQAPDAGPDDGFGASISLWGEFLAVASPGEDSGSTGIDGDPLNEDALNSGAVYLFRRSDDDWIPVAFIKASNPSVGGIRGIYEPYGDGFGGSVALWEDTLVAGAHGEDSRATGINADPTLQHDDSVEDSGAIYVFH